MHVCIALRLYTEQTLSSSSFQTIGAFLPFFLLVSSLISFFLHSQSRDQKLKLTWHVYLKYMSIYMYVVAGFNEIDVPIEQLS
jgi:hypothetical protein